MGNLSERSLESSEVSVEQAKEISYQARLDRDYYESASFNDVEIHSELFNDFI